LVSIIDGAIERRDAELAMRTARNVSRPQLELDRALRLTIMLGEVEAPSFQAAARRWIARFCTEETPTIEQVRKTADALDQLPKFTLREPAAQALHYLADQLRQRRH
jgi:hypothetical protein